MAAGSSPVVRVTWLNSGASGIATGTSFWNTGPIPLKPGLNQIAIQAFDSANHAASAFANVIQTGTPPGGSPDIRRGFFRGRQVTYEVVDGVAKYEGDIILGSPSQLQNPDGSAAPHPSSSTTGYNSSLWPKVGGVVTVPYVVTSGTANLTSAINQFNGIFTGQMQWIPRTAETDYVNINLNLGDTSGTCDSTVGHTGGMQSMAGSGSCAVSTLLHEMGHTMGLWHEQSRKDRATYVSVLYQNIIKSLIDNFNQLLDNEIDVGLYDRASIMHYDPYGFSKNGDPTLESIPAGIPLSNNTGYSAGDLDGLRRMYGFTPTQVTITSNPVGLQVIIDGGAPVTTPQVVAWALNSTHTLSVPAGLQTVGGTKYNFAQWNDLGAATHTVTVTPGNGLTPNPPTAPQVTVYQADFIQLVAYTPQGVFPGGSGTITPSPAPVMYPGDATNSYFTARQQVSLTATPAGGFTFFNWYNISARSFSMNPLVQRYSVAAINPLAGFSNQVVTTITTNNPPKLGVRVDGNFYYGPQSFESTQSGPTWNTGGTHTISADTPQLPYSANTRYAFQNWSDAGANSHGITVNAANPPFTANFQTQYKVTTSVNQGCAGTIGLSPTSPDLFYAAGSPVTFTVTPAGGWVFTGFQGAPPPATDLTGTANPQTIPVNDEILVKADFNTVATPLAIQNLAPAYVTAGGGDFTMTINGFGFTPGSIVFINNQFSGARAVTFVSSNVLTVQMFAADIAVPGGVSVAVQNSPGGAPCGAFGNYTLFVASAGIVPPTADSVSPNTGTGATQSFTFTFSDVYGAHNINNAYAVINSTLRGADACYVIYNRAANILILVNDAGTGFVGSITPGSGSLTNSQCTLNGASSSATSIGNSLVVVANLTFKAAFPGTRNIYMLDVNLNGANSGFQLRGSWNTGFTAAAPTIDVSPKNSNGPTQLFSINLSDANGSGNIGASYLIFNTTLTGANACYVVYYATANSLYLVNDAGNGILGPLTPGGGGSVTNSQCQLSPGGAITVGATTIAVPINLTFLPAFAGTKNIYGLAFDSAFTPSSWQVLGTWTR